MTSTITADRPWMPAIMSRTRFLLSVSAAFLIQAGLLAAMVVDRALLLSRGTEIRLPVVPVDPRDFLRGDYVILSYPDRKSTRLNSSHANISYAVFCLKKKKKMYSI